MKHFLFIFVFAVAACSAPVHNVTMRIEITTIYGLKDTLVIQVDSIDQRLWLNQGDLESYFSAGSYNTYVHVIASGISTYRILQSPWFKFGPENGSVSYMIGFDDSIAAPNDSNAPHKEDTAHFGMYN